MSRPSFAAAHLAAIALFMGTAPARAAAPASAPRVLTSFLPAYCLTLAIAGDRARVENWLPAGVDPHEFQFSPRDLTRLREADILVVNGLGLEGWTEAHLRDISGNERLRLIEAARSVPASELIHQDAAGHADGDRDHGEDDAHGVGTTGANPHIWLDPTLFARTVTAVAEALAGADPAGADVYRRNAATYVARLEALDREFQEGLRDRRQVAFITQHNAFPYLARRYQLRLVGVIEATAAEQPSARELAELSETVRREGARVLFTDGRPSSIARRLAADLKLELARLDTLETGEFTPDAYLEGMRRNLNALRTALRSRSSG
jgi:ABC-type Zn uptake system ZnuABC Zn-binding protein ZnuA